jgi:dihydrofolate reductase
MTMSGTESGQVIWHITISLDGFIAGPDHAMEWAFDQGGGPNAMADEVMNSTGAILGGRNWYDAATRKYRGRRGIYGGKWNGPVFVLTHRPLESPEDSEITFLTTGLEDAVATPWRAPAARTS